MRLCIVLVREWYWANRWEALQIGMKRQRRDRTSHTEKVTRCSICDCRALQHFCFLVNARGSSGLDHQLFGSDLQIGKRLWSEGGLVCTIENNAISGGSYNILCISAGFHKYWTGSLWNFSHEQGSWYAHEIRTCRRRNLVSNLLSVFHPCCARLVHQIMYSLVWTFANQTNFHTAILLEGSYRGRHFGTDARVDWPLAEGRKFKF